MGFCGSMREVVGWLRGGFGGNTGHVHINAGDKGVEKSIEGDEDGAGLWIGVEGGMEAR